ncbi:hypothetical protein WSM22_41230 [Cytophagales bacterium WSM2-2]|nr:hypothetical protein WSM22_41230 [Cytophagales bacterium WSM2-2]
MKRRSFIVVSVFSLFGIGVFSFIRWIRNSGNVKELANPRFLSLLCDSSTIRTLGRAYLKLKPGENGDDILLNDLLTEKFHKKLLERTDMLAAESQIEERIKQDFDSNNIVIVQGWVLSVTEARQCAFFSILNS